MEQELVDKIASMTPLQRWHLEWLGSHPEYEERPVDIRTFIDSPLYLDAKSECWEAVKLDLEELFQGYDDPDLNWKYNEAAFDEGIGAGKSYKSSLIISYLLYRTLILKDPQAFYNLASGSPIYFMNMSVRGDQAKRVVFGEVTQRINNSVWFRDRNYLPSPLIRSELQFPKNINVVPGNSKETFPLGYNLLGAVMDEAAHYIDTDSHDVAEEIFNALHNRIKNRFGDRGMLIMISSPRYVDDFIEKKMEEAKTNPKILSRRRAVWEAKPKTMYSGNTFEYEGYNIPVEYEVEARRNFDRFKRDYMAIPSLALEPYFKYWALVEQAICPDILDPLVGATFKPEFKGDPRMSYFVHIDLSLVSDSTGIAMCHPDKDKVYVDLLMRITPPEEGEIDLAEIRTIVAELKARNFCISKCTFDQFQSAGSIQELNKMGISAERLSVDATLAPYETLKEAIYTGRLKMYRSEDLLAEMRRLELVRGRKVDHPANSSKDLSDALAGCVYNCISYPNIFSFGFAGEARIPAAPAYGISRADGKVKSEAELMKEAAAQPADGLVPYGWFRGRRAY